MGSLLPLLLLLHAAATASTEGDTDYVLRQKALLKLLEKITQGSTLHIPEHDEVLESFNWESLKDKFEEPHFLEYFMYLYDHGFYPERNKDISITHFHYLRQVRSVYAVLRSASDFDTFWKVAVWMRYSLNQRIFTHALFSVLPQRNDTQRLILPALYEVFPQYFVTSDVMQRAYDAHLRGQDVAADNPVLLSANYTGWEEPAGGESSVSYFREDVGLAAYWASWEYQQPPWLNTSVDAVPEAARHGGPRLYVHIRNLLARYDMERYSRGLPPVTQAELWEPVEGYDPHIRQQNGQDFPGRPDGLKARSTDELSLEDIMDWERRIRDGIAMSIYLNELVEIKHLRDPMKIIGGELRADEDSPNRMYYGALYYGLFTIFGSVTDPYHKRGRAPSVLQIPETMTRDPLFYRILKRMWSVMDGCKSIYWWPYTKEELVSRGLKIESMKIDKLTTFFDDFKFHIDNAIEVQSIEDANKTNVIAVQRRLNHTEFSYHLNVSSECQTRAVVRLFLGPAEGSGRLWTGDHRGDHFYLMDAFDLLLEVGQNSVVRSSGEMFFAGQELPGLRELLQQVESGRPPAAAASGRMIWQGFPRSLLLPQGRPEGLPATLVVVLTGYFEPQSQGHTFTDGRDPFFPMDRGFFMWELESTPNAHVQQVRIFHRSKDELDDSEQ